MSAAAFSMLPDGRRLHLHHGPIDLIVDAEGPGREAALSSAKDRFAPILDELVAELPALRTSGGPEPTGHVARTMYEAVIAHAPVFATPMAAVAGAVADAVLAAMAGADGLTRAYVNNGGDIALHLTNDTSFTAALGPALNDRAEITWRDAARGVATSGWKGRSYSLGIADNVTVLAETAAKADVAATLIANEVDLPGHPKISRRPACELSPDSDLGNRLVTTNVVPLDAPEIASALDRGLRYAEICLARGLITAALLSLGPARRTIGPSLRLPTSSGAPDHA